MKTRISDSLHTYKCHTCGKMHRDTGAGEYPLGLCIHCMGVYLWTQAVKNGYSTVEDTPLDLRGEVRTAMEVQQ